jgi:branched-chain amino acid transport system substrate-binding protein
MPGAIFVSCSREDHQYVEGLARHLAERGLTVWYDPDPQTSERFASVIQPQIAQAAAFVLVVSRTSAVSPWVDLELSYARSIGRPVLPVLLEDAPLPLLVHNVPYEDVRGGRLPGAAFVDALSQAVAAPPPGYAAPGHAAPGYGPPGYGPVPLYPAAGGGASPPGWLPPPPPGSAGRPWRRNAGLLAGIAAVLVVVLVTVTVVLLNRPDGASSNLGASGPTTPAPLTSTPAATTPPPSKGTLTVAVDLPFQGYAGGISMQTFQLMNLYLDRIGHRAGSYTVNLKQYDDSTATAGKWDAGTCRNNALRHVASNEVAVVGPWNSGCAMEEVPALDEGPGGMLMVSDADTNPGLTKPWGPGDPDQYYPAGFRNYAEVLLPDDYQAVAAAALLHSLGAHSVYVLSDQEIYGDKLADTFVAKASAAGLTVAGQDTWDARSTSYTGLFQKAKAAGADAVYLGGIFNNNGGQLIKDKVAVMGDNTKVPLVGPDGFTGYPDMDKLPQAAGMYMTFSGLDADQIHSSLATELASDDESRYGGSPDTSYPYYGVLALQVVLAAIAQSDGTREGIRKAVLAGTGVTVPSATCVLGRDFHIDPHSGDPTDGDVSVLQLANGSEQLNQTQRV